jgi:4-carboxymuconolactone decarboxylase
MSDKALQRGMKTRRKVLGDEHVDRAVRTQTPFNADFQRLITRYAWDEIWNRPHFDHRTRRLLVLSMTAAQARWEEFRLHVRAGLESGDLEQDDIKEVLLQAAIYCGIPVANHAFREAKAEIDALAGKPKGKRRKP